MEGQQPPWENKVGMACAKAVSGELSSSSCTTTTLSLGSKGLHSDCVRVMVEGLKQNARVTSLDLSFNGLSDLGAFALAELLREDSSLTALNVGSTGIFADGAEALFEALKRNTTLKLLDQQRNYIMCDGIKSLAEMLERNNALTVLTLSCNEIDLNSARDLAIALNTNKTLRILDLSYTDFNIEKVGRFENALTLNSTLTKLVLSGNYLRHLGAKLGNLILNKMVGVSSLELECCGLRSDDVFVIVAALKSNSRMRFVNLGCNRVGDKGATAVAEWLKKRNCLLAKLDLRDSHIGNAGAAAIAEALKQNSVLGWMDLCDNEIDQLGVDALADALLHNYAMTHLGLDAEYSGEAGGKKIEKQLQVNRDRRAELFTIIEPKIVKSCQNMGPTQTRKKVNFFGFAERGSFLQDEAQGLVRTLEDSPDDDTCEGVERCKRPAERKEARAWPSQR